MESPNQGYLLPYPGCTLKASAIAYEESLLTLYRLLGVPIKELEDWNCCGATSYISIEESFRLYFRGEKSFSCAPGRLSGVDDALFRLLPDSEESAGLCATLSGHWP